MKLKNVKLSNVILLIIMILGIFSAGISNTYKVIPVRNVILDNNSLSNTNYFAEFDKYTLNHIEDQKKVEFTGYNEIFLSDLYELDLISKDSVDRKVQTKYDCVYDYDNELVTLNVTLVDGEKTTIIDSMQGDLIKNDKNEFDVVFNIDGEKILLSEMQQNDAIDNVGFFSSLKRLWKSTIGKIGTIVTVATCAVVGVVCAVIPGGQLVTAACIGVVVGMVGFGATAAAVSYEENGKIDWNFVVESAVVGGVIGGTTSALSFTITSQVLTKGAMKAALKSADKNPLSKQTFIGKFDKSSSISYEKVASSKGYNHFNMSQEKYNSFINKYGSKSMEEVNKNFLRAKYRAGNDFITNINPFEKNKGAFAKELEWLNEFGAKGWEDLRNGLWKLIK